MIIVILCKLLHTTRPLCEQQRQQQQVVGGGFCIHVHCQRLLLLNVRACKYLCECECECQWVYEGECAHMWVCVCVSSVCEFVLDFIWFCVALGIYLPTPRHVAATPPPHPLLLNPCTRTSKKLRLRFFCFFFYIFFFREREKKVGFEIALGSL